ncbi:exported hypothetical protein [Capnocytophaga canimorsus]|uniref:Uncharacterized protein n=1 Tax=Capnocytophaga canimorsus TaxID=28188 RepID=A0A0B7H3H3_9FLAO|nr:hypothetical protein [Capnocytophaga canimorsus]ATA76358.1 hypothetical protein CGC47_01475 [Capnocytophaga canimorsus]ATA90923.1 hypothetical protein CGC56_01295 [Capnocytophaga canimorsus]PJI79572.1 hypothetical protein CLV61_1458 [Capnocytophaga canimorsus]CEN34136.1 exported hypothetical protein [Capnocytophaga canimorsus]STA71497.1 Uncharacterised protein [Capnocytophaga canimorsus]
MNTNNNTPTKKKKKNKKKGNKIVILLLVVLALLFFIFNREKKIKEDKPDLNVPNGSGSSSGSSNSGVVGSSGSKSLISSSLLSDTLRLDTLGIFETVYSIKRELKQFSDLQLEHDLNYYNVELAKMLGNSSYRFSYDEGQKVKYFNEYLSGNYKFYLSEMGVRSSESLNLELGTPIIITEVPFFTSKLVCLGILIDSYDKSGLPVYYCLNLNRTFVRLSENKVFVSYTTNRESPYKTKRIFEIEFETKAQAQNLTRFLSQFL